MMKYTPENLQRQKELQSTYAHKKEERVKHNKNELQNAAGRKRIRELAAERV
jgi:hypothetical protein